MTTAEYYIVFCGDGKKNCRLFREALAGMHFKALLKVVKTQSQLQEILCSPGSLVPDVVFLDLKIPEHHKPDILPDFVNSGRYKNFVAVAYATYGSENYLENIYVNGENISIGKPYDLSVMRALLSQVLILNRQYSRSEISLKNEN